MRRRLANNRVQRTRARARSRSGQATMGARRSRRALDVRMQDARDTLDIVTVDSRVGVGIMIAHDPLHRSGRAALTHPAPTLGDDA